jgi:enoyl-CoA hydratase/carnithine racemase
VGFETLRYEVDERVCTLTLNRPEKLNAVTATSIEELIAAFDEADRDDNVRVVIVTGAGRAFCAGADLSGGGGTFEHGGPTAQDPQTPFSRPEACSTWFLPRIVGIAQAAEWVYTGRVFDAEEALRAGLVSRVVAPEALLPTARALAREIADNTSAVSVALSRQLLWKLLGADHPMEGHRLDSQGMFWTGRSADAREGVTSFIEKRPPRFTLTPSADMPPFYPWWEPRS